MPEPPYSGGTAMPRMPSSASFLTFSHGKLPSMCASARARNSPCASSRTVPTKARCSSDSRNIMEGRSVFRRNEHVADAAHGADGAGMRRVDLDLAAQAGDAQVDRPVERLHLAVGGGLQQPVALQRPVGVLGEQLEHVE